MGRCILHYGMHKTGSSSIQHYLLDRMKTPAFKDLNLMRRGSGNLMASAFLDAPEHHHRNLKRGVDRESIDRERQKMRHAMRQQLQRCGNASAIFSSELLAKFSEVELRSLCDFLAPFREEIRACGYVRPPASFMESVFQQRVKGGSVNADPSRNYPRYRERFEKFETVLGRGNVDYWLFDPRAFPGQCVVQDFCQRLGIPFEGGPMERFNESMSLPAIRLLYVYRIYGPGFGVGTAALKENGDLKNCLRGLPGPKLRFHASLVVPVLQRNHYDIAWMEERLGCPLAEELCEDPAAVRGEEDLLRIDADSLAWLAQQIGQQQPWRWRASMPPEEVAEGVHRLRLTLARRRESAETSLAARATKRWQGLLRRIRRSAR